MKRALYAWAAGLLSTLPAAAETPIDTAITYNPATPTNQVLLAWEAVPSKQYRVQTTAALGQPWQTLTNTPLVASNNLVRFGTRADATARFYRVSKLDTEPPEIWRLEPATDAVAVARQGRLTICLNEETGIASNSIVLTVGTNLPVTLADPRLALAGSALTYTPGTNEFLGPNGQTLTTQLIIADTLGNRATNAWPIRLEPTPILASNVVLIGPGSPLTLVATNGGTFVFSYTGTSSGLATNSILVSTDTNFLYKIKVLSLSDNPVSHTVSLVTAPAGLAECFLDGSARLTAAAGEIAPGLGARAKDGAGVTLPLDGTVIYDNGTTKVQVLSGRFVFDPSFTVSGEFQNGRLVTFDAAISATLELDLTVQGSFPSAGDWNGSRALTTPQHSLKLLAFAGPVPVWVESVLELNIGYAAHLEAPGSATAGFQSARAVEYGAQLRNGQWSSYARQRAGLAPVRPAWQVTGSGRLRGYVQPKLTINLENLAGPTADLRPYLELEGSACVPPGQAGADLSLCAGLDSTLTGDVRGWDPGFGTPPAWELFNLRGLIWHQTVATTIGATVQPIPNMVWIPCGAFTMGSADSEPGRWNDEGPQTRVTFSRGFWVGKYEVTQAEYLTVVGSNPSFFKGGFYGTDLNRPVEQVSWSDAVAYCAALTTRERSAGRLPAGYAYRLPREAEWEYACRAGTTTPFHNGPELRSGMANFQGYYEYLVGDPNHYNPSGISLGRTTTVGSYAPNAWGLHDMLGNVREWCQDWYGNYPGGSVTDPPGPAGGGRRVVRGGSWGDMAGDCRSARREADDAPDRHSEGGFRVVLAPVP